MASFLTIHIQYIIPVIVISAVYAAVAVYLLISYCNNRKKNNNDNSALFIKGMLLIVCSIIFSILLSFIPLAAYNVIFKLPCDLGYHLKAAMLKLYVFTGLFYLLYLQKKGVISPVEDGASSSFSSKKRGINRNLYAAMIFCWGVVLSYRTVMFFVAKNTDIERIANVIFVTLPTFIFCFYQARVCYRSKEYIREFKDEGLLLSLYFFALPAMALFGFHLFFFITDGSFFTVFVSFIILFGFQVVMMKAIRKRGKAGAGCSEIPAIKYISEEETDANSCSELEDALLKDAEDIIDAEAIRKRILLLFETQKPYLHSGLKMEQVARSVGTNRNYLSKVINNCWHRNFNQFCNFYRVFFACEMFIRHKVTTLEGMQKISGFETFSSFSTAFNLNVRITPGKWCHMVLKRQEEHERVSAGDYLNLMLNNK